MTQLPVMSHPSIVTLYAVSTERCLISDPHAQTRSSLQPHIADALRKQSQQLQASAVPKETTTRIEGQQLKRGSSKRRSL